MKDGILDLWCILKYNTSDLARFLRYQIFGLFVTLTQFLTIMILINLFDARGVVYLENIFNLIATELSFLVAFQLHKIYTWRIKFHSWGDAFRNFLGFHGISFFSFAIRLILFYFFSRMGMDYRLNTILGIPVSVVLNFIGYDRLFDKRDK